MKNIKLININETEHYNIIDELLNVLSIDTTTLSDTEIYEAVDMYVWDTISSDPDYIVINEQKVVYFFDFVTPDERYILFYTDENFIDLLIDFDVESILIDFHSESESTYTFAYVDETKPTCQLWYRGGSGYRYALYDVLEFSESDK